MSRADRLEQAKLSAMRDRLANEIARELVRHFDHIGHPCHAGAISQFMRFAALKAVEQDRRFWRRRGGGRP